jgi:hypothetical protein
MPVRQNITRVVLLIATVELTDSYKLVSLFYKTYNSFNSICVNIYVNARELQTERMRNSQ